MDERTGQRFQTRLGDGNQGDGGAKNQISAPSISLPKCGDAIRGMGEKFAANPVAGIGSMTAHNRGTSWYIPNLSRHEEHSACGAGWGIDGVAQNLSPKDIASTRAKHDNRKHRADFHHADRIQRTNPET